MELFCFTYGKEMYTVESKLKRSQDYLKPYMGMELYTVQSMRCWYANILYVIGMNIIINKTNPIASLVQHTIIYIPSSYIQQLKPVLKFIKTV